MKIAFLILAHKNPQQLELFFSMLRNPSFSFFIHLDKKVPISEFIHLKKYENVFFIHDRVKMKWAGYSLVQGTINGIKEILNQDTKYDYINLLSGQDLPIKSVSYIENFLATNFPKQFITVPVYKESDPWWQEALVRVETYAFHNWTIPGKYRLQFLFNKIMPKRKYPIPGHVVAGRSQWFCITNDAAKYILKFLDNNPKVVRFFKYVWGADEFIFSTILYNSEYKESISDNLVYTDWSEGKANPKILRSTDYDALITSDKLFARKFDITIDPEIIERVTNYISN